MKEKWTEEEVKFLPPKEHDYFERKSGQILSGTDFQNILAKAICAFANSGGGHLIIGVKDDETFDGVEPLLGKSKTSTRDYIEQIVPNLLENQLSTFRVHQVIPSPESSIPPGKILIVIDVDDSPFAPHQARYNHTYFYRPGGRSAPAPHFYLENLRNRIIKPIFAVRLLELELMNATQVEVGIIVSILAKFEVENIGKAMSKCWTIDMRCSNYDIIPHDIFHLDCKVKNFHIPNKKAFLKTDALLPSMTDKCQAAFGIVITTPNMDKNTLQESLNSLLSKVKISYAVISEIGRGEEKIIPCEIMHEWINPKKILWVLPNWDDQYEIYCGHGIYCIGIGIINGTSSTYHDLTCYIANKSDNSFTSLHIAIGFRRRDGILLHLEEVNVERLPNHSEKLVEISIKKTNLPLNMFAYITCSVISKIKLN